MIATRVAVLCLLAWAGPVVGQTPGPSYDHDIRPILADTCFHCHGPDGGSRQAGLRLDRAEDALESVIVPGQPEASELIRRIRSDDPDVMMPPPESKLTLTDDQRSLLETWIEHGAVYEQHWSFVSTPERIDPPRIDDPWIRDPIDAFVLDRLTRVDLTPTGEATRSRWLRRVTFDLTGLPPELDDVQAFLDDELPDAYEHVVDQLLASPHYGERMAVPWLDLARYADSYGYQSDLLSLTWPWRDWVVRALNAGMPYDEFITRQLAGDLLPDATRDDHLATAFNRLHRMTNEGGSIPDEWRAEYAADRANTFGTALLGLTIECARCHDHKFDPITQREYYQIVAYFNSIDEYGLYDRSEIVPTPSILLPTAEQTRALDEARAGVDAAETLLVRVAGEADAAFEAWLGEAPDAVPPDRVGLYPFDEIEADRGLRNEIADTTGRVDIGTSTELPRIVDGRRGGALALDGDNLAHLPGASDLDRWTPYTISFWLRDDEADPGRRVVAQRSSGTDAGPFGHDLMLEDGYLVARVFRHWPGNGIGVRSREPVFTYGRWTHVVWRYDGSSRAAGLTLFVDGESVATEVLRDRMWKTVGGGATYGPGGHDLILGQRFRDRGLRGGQYDDVTITRRAVSDLECLQLFDPEAIDHALGAPSAHRDRLRAYYLGAVDEGVRAATAARQDARRRLVEFENGIAEIMTMAELPTPRPTHVLARGVYDAPRSADTRVERDVPAVLGAEDRPSDRLELARWLTSPEHPLTARVAVNRLWAICFGRGLVSTGENFGAQGQSPTHPALLDYLASEFVRGGWDVKAMLRRIVLSATYRQDSTASVEGLERDPENVWYGRGPRRRLDAEMIRDTALAVSGLLARETGGPPVRPYQPDGLWRAFNSMSPAYQQGDASHLHRRSMYTVWKRTAPMPNMTSFDAPGREACVVRRSETNTPLQALVLLNDIQFVEAARVLAERTMREHETDRDRVIAIFRRLATRRPTSREIELLTELLVDQRERYRDDPAAAETLVGLGVTTSSPELDAIEVAALTIVAQAVLNADVTVWRR